MFSFRPPPHLVVHETEHWVINHRLESTLPGYLMAGSKQDTNCLNDLPPAALSELGLVLATAQRILTEVLAPAHFYIGRYGHMAGHSLHFHVIPICSWVAEAFARDERYRVLRDFYTPGVYEDGGDESFDGAEMTFFVWREFCESRTPPPISGPSMEQAVERIRLRWKELASVSR